MSACGFVRAAITTSAQPNAICPCSSKRTPRKSSSVKNESVWPQIVELKMTAGLSA